jgi:hypothetical protein
VGSEGPQALFDLKREASSRDCVIELGGCDVNGAGSVQQVN